MPATLTRSIAYLESMIARGCGLPAARELAIVLLTILRRHQQHKNC